MSFTEKTDLSVLNIKLTTKGREQLSKGKLKFSKFALGDSEIDYGLIEKRKEYEEWLKSLYPGQTVDFTSFSLFKPVDLNPNIISYIPITPDGGVKKDILGVPSYRNILNNQRQSIGCFNIDGETITIKNEIIKNSSSSITTANGTNVVVLNYGGGSSASEGDYLLIKNVSGNTININSPSPHLFYKVESVTGNNVTVDRNIPSSFNGYHVVMFVSNIGETLYGEYPSDYFFDDDINAFFDNYTCDIAIFPYWRFSVIFTENIPGVDAYPDNGLGGVDRSFIEYRTSKMGGFVSYIQNHKTTYKTLGVIHYTNPSPSNVYAEGLYRDNVVVDIPTIMWDRKDDGKMGVKLTSYGNEKQLIQENNSLNIKYYDLADEDGYVVGKIFNGLKIIVIENQDLLFAMSYKSNRSWTLSKHYISLTS